MLLLIDLPFKTYMKIMNNVYDYGDMNLIIQKGLRFDVLRYLMHDEKETAQALEKIHHEIHGKDGNK